MKYLNKILVPVALILSSISIIFLTHATIENTKKIAELQAINKDMAIVILRDDDALNVLFGAAPENDAPLFKSNSQHTY